MKLKHLILAGGVAALSYWVTKNRKEIISEAKETAALTKQTKKDYQAVQENIERLKAYQEPVTELLKDFQYKLRTYKQSIAGNLSEIEKFQERYSTDQDEK
ncbi:hypothetical protein D3X11_05375 [Streptococcus sp. X16XC17]|uniref:hypothetical protein n=1 Tax=unclassified Streptococcus TaxID=2608887 RepID=UPI00066FC09C|nr:MULTISPECIES: hypothetical protein [unclassified Streptococcus]TCD45658.1 hypothetical protein D3X11_05375 [Streptococcus sp. X16XC17]